MLVEIKPIKLTLRYRHGVNEYEIQQDYDQARVYVDGEQVGLTMTNPRDRFHRILHPLSRGYPREFLQMIVDASNGELLGTLNGPKPEPEPDIDEEDDCE